MSFAGNWWHVDDGERFMVDLRMENWKKINQLAEFFEQ